MIPVAVNPVNGNVTWLDLEQYHAYHGFFDRALAFYFALNPQKRSHLFSTLHSLVAIDKDSCIPPSGFIFHAGRCGSTLLTKILARSRRNLVFGEAVAHNQIWPAMAGSGGFTTDAYRALLLAMGRPRLESYHNHIVKFTSFNILHYKFIRAAFPKTPALFLFRDPGPLLASYRRDPPGWMGCDPGTGAVYNTPETAVEAFFRAALNVSDGLLRCLEYSDLKPERLTEILELFGITASPAEQRQMLSEFQLDAKSAAPRPYVRRSPASQFAPEILCDLYRQLQAKALDTPARV